MVTLALSVHAHGVADDRLEAGLTAGATVVQVRCHIDACAIATGQSGRTDDAAVTAVTVVERDIGADAAAERLAGLALDATTDASRTRPTQPAGVAARTAVARIDRQVDALPAAVGQASGAGHGPCGSPGQTKPILVTSVQRVVSDTPSKQQSAAPYWPPLQHSASLLQVPPKRVQVPQKPSALQGWPLQQPPVPIPAHSPPSPARIRRFVLVAEAHTARVRGTGFS